MFSPLLLLTMDSIVLAVVFTFVTLTPVLTGYRGRFAVKADFTVVEFQVAVDGRNLPDDSSKSPTLGNGDDLDTDDK